MAPPCKSFRWVRVSFVPLESAADRHIPYVVIASAAGCCDGRCQARRPQAHRKTQAAQGVGFDVALERAGELVRDARAKLVQLPPNAPEAERQKVQAEVQRLESMFFGPGSPVLEMLRVG